MDPPEDEDFRREFRAWLERTAPRRGGPGDFSQRPIDPSLPPDRQQELEAAHARRCLDWQRTLYDAGFACVAWPTEYGGRGGTPDPGADRGDRAGPVRRVVRRPVRRARHGRPDAAGTRHTGAEGAPPPAPGPRRGAVVPAVQRARRRVGPRRLSTRAEPAGAGGGSTARRCGARGADDADFGVLLARTDPEAPAARRHLLLRRRLAAPGVEARPIRQITGAATSARCS